MTLKSPLEDFRGKSLTAVSGQLPKLAYVAGLRAADGSYGHWGLARVHGEAAAQQAVTEAHRRIVSTILKTPLRQLLREMEESISPEKRELADFLAGLNRDRLMPPRPGAGTERHLDSVLGALSSLVEPRH
jgi:hypothetical protein